MNALNTSNSRVNPFKALKTMRWKSLFLAMLVLSLPAYAQSQRVTVGVVPFTHSRYVSPSHAQSIFLDVQSKLAESGRVNLVEIEQLDAIEQEIDVQGDEAYLGGNIVDLAPEGAEYLLVGTVTAAIALLRSDSLGYDSVVSYELRLVSVSTREVTCSAVIKKANSVGRCQARSYIADTK